MKIVMLEGESVKMGDLELNELKKYDNINIYDITSQNEVIERIKDAEIVINNKLKFGEKEFSAAPKLKLICQTSTGYDCVDMKYANSHNVTVCNIPSYSSESVAQMVFALILEACFHVGEHNRSVKEGSWKKSLNFSYFNYPLIELSGKKLGIVGYGSIGKAVGRIGSAFNMEILYYSKSNPKNSIEEIFSTCDFISINCPLTDETRGFVNSDILKLMKKNSYIINTSRGGVINEVDLSYYLNNNLIGGACLDVLSTEPPINGNPLIDSKNTIITPHIAWATIEARKRLLVILSENIDAFLAGEPKNVVN